MQAFVGVSADCKNMDGQAYHVVQEKYLTAVSEVAHCRPLIIPALLSALDVGALVDRIDGLVLTGRPSNVHPTRYDREPAPEFEPYDEQRDRVIFSLVEAALDRGLPLLGLCRGFQEINVAFGGTLHARLHEVAGRNDHRRPQTDDRDVEYGPKHSVTFVAGGKFTRLAGTSEIQVNSLHDQGIGQLGYGLVAEGHGSDGTVEAIRIERAHSFGLAVQWHPEYQAARNEFSVKLFESFGDAVRRHSVGPAA